MERRLAAILAADVVGYSALMERDEAGTHRRLVAGRKELFEPEIARHHGRIFKLMGDGLLAEFGSVVDAVECAVSLQRGLKERNSAVADDQRLQVRIGINLGEVIVEGEDRYGEGVNIAARLEQLAEPGGIWVSAKVAREVEKKLAFGFEPMGEQRVKNIAEPIMAFRVKLDGAPRPRRFSASRRIVPWQGLAAVVAVIAIVGVWLGYVRTSEPVKTSANVSSIAVLPFDDLSPDKSLGYLGDGVSEDIITMLSRFPDVSVMARNSSFAYKGKPMDVRQIGRELNVDFVLEGSVRKEADQVRIVAQLIDAHTGAHVWAERYDKAGQDPWALQDDVTAKIIGTITGEAGEMRRAQYRDVWGKDTARLEEYDYYLRGHDAFLNSRSKQDNDRAGRIWHEGLAKYPDSDLLRVEVGWYHFWAAYAGWSDDIKEDFRKAGEFVRQVLARENLSPQVKRYAHWLLAFVLAQEGDFQRAAQEADQVVAMAPFDAFAVGQIADVFLLSGQPQKALEQTEFSLARDPNRTRSLNYTRGWALRLLGRYKESIAAFKLSGYPDGDRPLQVAIDLVHLGRLDEAKAEVKLMLEKNDASFTQSKWRLVYFYSDLSIVEDEVKALGQAGLAEK